MSDKLKKNQISKILGLNKSTIRYYEQAGLIKPVINDNKYREYGIEELKLLSQINFMRTIGLNIDTISNILNDEWNNSFEILNQKKKELNDLIELYKNNINKIDEILKYSSTITKPMNYKIQNLQKRYLYRIKCHNGDLEDFYKENEDFFKANTISMGDWFVNAIDVHSFLDEEKTDFIEYIEVKNNRNKECVFIPEGKFICFDIIFENNDKENWKEIINYICEILLEHSLEIRDEKVLFINKDNLNFNFNDGKRLISIQIPVTETLRA